MITRRVVAPDALSDHISGDVGPCEEILHTLAAASIPVSIEIDGEAGRPHATVEYVSGLSIIKLPMVSTTRALYHECLHLKRTRLDRLPFLSCAPSTPQNRLFDLSILGNSLHHAFILPEEFCAFSGAREAWLEEMATDIADVQALHSDGDSRNTWIAATISAVAAIIFGDSKAIGPEADDIYRQRGIDLNELVAKRLLLNERSVFHLINSVAAHQCHPHVRFAMFDEQQRVVLLPES